MKNPLSDIYEQIILNEAEKHALQNPSQDEVGNLKAKQDLFGSKPKAVEGPDKAKLKQGPAYKETSGSASKPTATKSSMPNSAPAKETKAEEPEEVKDTEAEPEKEEETEEKKEEKKKEVKEESFTMSAFETLFKKTLTEEINEIEAPASEMSGDEELDLGDEETEESSEDELEEEESDLISDLRDLQDRLASILSKLEDVQAEEEELEESEEEATDEDYEDEFGDETQEEAPMKESVDKPKALSDSKGKGLMSKKNKVGRLSAKGGKAHGGTLKNEPKPKALGDKKGALQKGKPEVRSSVKKGDFIK